MLFKRYDQFKQNLPPGIQGIWSLSNTDAETSMDLIPDGHPEIIIPLAGKLEFEINGRLTEILGNRIVGQINLPTRIYLGKNTRVLMLKVYPSSLGQLVGEQAKDLTNFCEPLNIFSAELSDYFDAFLSDYHSRLELTQCIDNLLERLNPFFNGVQHPLLELDQTLKYQMISKFEFDNKKIKTIYSNRYLEKLYEKQIGLSPKQFLKILRVKKASMLMASHRYNSLGEIANTLGFYDLSHLYKDFKSLSYKSPKQFSMQQSNFHRNQEYLNQWDYS